MSSTITREEWQLANRAYAEKLASRDPQLIKQAEDDLTDFTRWRVREDGIFRQILPVQTVTAADLDRAVDTARLRIVIDLEPDSPGAKTVGFAQWPDRLYLETDRYPVDFHRIQTPEIAKDIEELATNTIDVRQVIGDNSVRDIMAEEDGNFLRAVNELIVGPNIPAPTSNTVQHMVLSGGVTRQNWTHSLDVLARTPSSFSTECILINNLTINRLMGWEREEMGGDLANDIAAKGWSMTEFFGKKLLVTIKKGLVPTNTAYHFAKPNQTGKAFEFTPVTLFCKAEAFFIRSFAYETIGCTIGNPNSVGRIDFTGGY